MKLSHKFALYCELAGIVLILITFGVQNYFETDVANLYTDCRYYELDAKLNDLWTAAQQCHYDTHPSDDKLNYWGMVTDWRALDTDWKSIASKHEYVEGQADDFRYAQSFFYIIGSILLTVGRLYDIQERPKG